MKVRLLVAGIASLVIGLIVLASRPVPDKHVFAGATAPETAAASSGQVAGDSTVSTPTATPSVQQVRTAPVVLPASTPVVAPAFTPQPTATPIYEPTPYPTPIPTATPWPTPVTHPPTGCGNCGHWYGPGPQGNIMCPQYCMETAL